MIKKLAEYVEQELKWVQPAGSKMEYELRAGDEVIAALRFRSSFGSFATATSADGTWTFKRVGFFQTKVTIRAAESDTDLAVFENNTWKSGGTLKFPNGREFLANTNFWANQWNFATESGEPLISYRKISGVIHLSSAVEIHPLAKGMPEMPLMVMLGWYLILMLNMDSALMASVIAST